MKFLAALLLLLATGPIHAAGISIDNGLTPPLDRWIVRTQVRMLGREPGTGMTGGIDNLMVPVVVAYGLRPNLTVIARQAFMKMESPLMEDSGLGDLFLMAKFKAFRLNTRDYTFGVAPVIGLELPTGSRSFSSDTWDLQPGVFTTFSHGEWSEDLSAAVAINGAGGKSAAGMDPGNSLNFDFAVARQFPLAEDYSRSLAPVLELSWSRVYPDRLDGSNLPNSGEKLFFVSPGLKFTAGSFVAEALVQVPVWQSQSGALPEREEMILLGTRVMF